MADDRTTLLQRQRVLANFGEFALASDDLDVVLTEACRLIGEAFGTGRAKVLEIEEGGTSLFVRAGVGWATDVVGQVRLPMGEPSSETYAIRERRPVISQDIRTETRFVVPAFMREAGVVALANVPIILPGGTAFGLLQVDATEPRDFDHEDSEFLRTYATILGPVIDRLLKANRLMAAEERFRLTVEEARDYAIFTTDAEDRITDWLPGAAAVFGWSAEEAVGQSASILFTPEDRAAGQDRWEVQKAQADGVAPNVRWHLRRDGSRVFIEGMVRALRNPDGTLRGFLKIGQDVTARNQAEATLRESEARFQALVNSIDQMVWSTRSDGFHDFYNQRWYDYTGVPPGSTDGEGWAGLFHPDDQAHAWSLWRRSLETGEPYHIEYRLRHRSGRYRWALGRAQAMRDADGGISRWYGTCTDIEDIVEARDVLTRSRGELEREVARRTAERDQLWTLSEDMLARADYQGMMTAVSPSWARVLGWSEAELLSRPYASLMHLDDMEPTLAALGRMGETGQPTRFENRIASVDGTWKSIEWLVAPEPDGAHFIAVGRDVSAAREREASLEAAQEALRQSHKMEAMGQLTGGVAHDFNNLLTPIIGALDRLTIRGVGTERERRLIDGALQSADRAKTLVQRLLSFARKQPLQPVAVDVAAVVQGMAGLMVSTLGPRMEVRLEIPPDLPPARADANQLEMALLNLAVNARDAMPEGGRLTVAASRESVRDTHPAGLRRGHYVRLAVSDTGIGMDEATLARAVEPFYSTKGIGKGTGLGLSMVHGLAAQLGGALTIQSRPGEGTTVELWLPISADPVSEADARRAAPGPGLPRGQALLVDDEDLVRMSTADMLADLGFEVVEAASAEEAMRLLHEGVEVDILVTDHLMPGMSGADLASAAKALRPGLAVLIVSGYAEVDGIAPDLPRLVKPFRAAELAERVESIMPGAISAD